MVVIGVVDMFPLIQLPKKLEVKFTELPFIIKEVSINSTSEEVRSATRESEERRQRQFPLIQLPKKLEELNEISKYTQSSLVSINSTSEEVRSLLWVE